MNSPEADAYYLVVDAAADRAVRELLMNPHDPDAGVVALRGITGRLAAQYGPGAVRDLAETLAADLAEALTLLADAQGLDPLTLLDSLTRDGPQSNGEAGNRDAPR